MAAPETSPQSSADMFPHLEKLSSEHKPLWSLKRWFGKDDGSLATTSPSTLGEAERPGVARRLSRKVIPGLPRPGTFKRQQSELRDKLEPTRPNPDERRAVSVDRRRNANVRCPSRSYEQPPPRLSAPIVMDSTEAVGSNTQHMDNTMKSHVSEAAGFAQLPEELEPDITKTTDTASLLVDAQSVSVQGVEDDLLDELEKRWILNLSMHFRDRSNREKFFVTYAETPTRWRRVTISLDYRDAPHASLEEDLQNTRFQRDKSARIYESIRDSLPDIQFYDTVTNLKLQTENDRLHVHVTEDIHEVIQFPPITAINHLHCRRIREDELVFDSHLSGFVYKVKVNEEIFIKKEIPGPDTVEEFLYEINALHRLADSKSVIKFGGVIIDNDERYLKGLLISYAERGALIDVIFDGKGELSWSRRERWAKQIVQGLSEIHEAGFVQGDFTLSNIVIDADDKAKIIDINRRGCPVGWEPPEVAALIESKQRISMYIGVKSDVFQLGMVLWAIAMEQDEPEVQPRPLTLDMAPDEIPGYYRDLVSKCLSDDPRKREHATALFSMFPDVEYVDDLSHSYPQTVLSDQSIDPVTVVARDDIDNYSGSSVTHTYVDPPTDMSSEPYYYLNRHPAPADGIDEPKKNSREGSTNTKENIHSAALLPHDPSILLRSVFDDVSACEERRGRSSSPRSVIDRLSESNALNDVGAPDTDTGSTLTKMRDVSLGDTDRPPARTKDDGLVNLDLMQPRVITASPSLHHPHGTAEYFSAFPPSEDSIGEGSDRPRETVPLSELTPGDLAGVGEHSTFEHSDFPRGVLDDDLTTDMQS